MDVWVVAAAAGAGYVAQRLKNLAKCNNNSSDLCSESSITRNKVKDKSCPFGRVLSRKGFGEEMPRDRDKALEDHSTASCSSNSNSLDGFSRYEDTQGDLEGSRVPFDIDETITSYSSEMGFSYGLRRTRSSLRSRRVNTRLVKPRTSLESCLMAQLYKEHAEIEEYTYSLHSLKEPILRPFIVTDGSRIISMEPRESFSEQTRAGKVKLGNDTFSNEKNNVVPVELKKKAKSRKGKMANGYHNSAQGGSSDRDFLFYHGLTMGIISSFLVNKREVEKLNKLLKQTENLVQDLQDELEMKDSLTVKELATEDYESRDVHNDHHFDNPLHALSLEQKLDDLSRYCNEESLSRIEAELEAELERLESNMNSSRLKSKVSNVAELDPNLVPDVIKGELMVDLFGAKNGNQPYADRDGSGNSTPRLAHYPVAPRELSFRLHEVIQSRLEERVKELETALHNTQMKLKYIESSSSPDSPIARNGPQSLDPPVVINLCEEALDAYTETYENLTKVCESDEDLGFGFKGQSEGDEYIMLNDILCGSDEESEDEMEKLLIKQIIEKAKQGSPAVLKAQRALLSNDECEYC